MYFRKIALPQGSHENDSGFTEFALRVLQEMLKFAW